MRVSVLRPPRTVNMYKILLVDDDEQLRGLIQMFLVQKGYQVLVTDNGEQALEVLQAEKPDLLVLDLTMPKKNGYEVCKAIRSNPNLEISRIKIIVASAKQYPLDIRAAQEAGADDYLTKPYHTGDLLAAIEELLGK